MVDVELWTVRADIQEVFCEEQHDQCYVSTLDGGDVDNYTYWEIFDHHTLATVEIPYIGEEDEVRNEVLIPALEKYLKEYGYLSDKQEVQFSGDCLSYDVCDAHTDEPLYRLVLG